MREHGADGLKAAAEPLCDHEQIRHDTFLLAGVQRARTSHPAHHLVQDQQYTVTIADLADRGEVTGHRRQRARRGAADGLRHERDDAPLAARADRVVQLRREAQPVLLGRLVASLLAIGVARRDVMRVDEERCEHRAPAGIAADRERAERVAVIALSPRDKEAAIGLADLDEILTRHLQRRLDRLRSAADQIYVLQSLGRAAGQVIGKSLCRLGREKAGVRERQSIDLRVHRRGDDRVTMAQAGHRSAAAGVEVLLASRVEQEDAFAADRNRRGDVQMPMEDVGHREPCSSSGGRRPTEGRFARPEAGQTHTALARRSRIDMFAGPRRSLAQAFSKTCMLSIFCP